MKQMHRCEKKKEAKASGAAAKRGRNEGVDTRGV
jgi:hypothetical protein